jgi:DtxR family Mn-dependent transcriptional regulator
MVEPLKALIIATMFIAVVLILFFPKHGLVARWSRAKRGRQRILIEDALKHIYDCEYNNIPCTLQSIAGALLISSDDAASLIARLSTMGLLTTTEKGVTLTPEGNSYALRVIRVHRLWERYLADETSVPQTEWHSSAELQEHKLTQAQTEALAAHIGNPHFDPHGDPIPTPSGELPPKKGLSLLSMNSGDFGIITHIEDEPEAVFAQLSAQGLYVGMQIMVIERSNERLRIAANGEEIILAPVLAKNITLEPLPVEEEKIVKPMETLASINIGEEATVLNISKACRGQQRRRLLDLGIVPGTKVRAEMRSASGDPTAYNVRGALVALRKHHAEMIFVQK